MYKGHDAPFAKLELANETKELSLYSIDVRPSLNVKECCPELLTPLVSGREFGIVLKVAL